MKKILPGLIITCLAQDYNAQSFSFEHPGARSAIIAKARIDTATLVSTLTGPSKDYRIVSTELFDAGRRPEAVAVSQGEELSTAQKALIRNAGYGGDLVIRVKYRLRNEQKVNGTHPLERTTEFAFTPGPSAEASFPGGEEELGTYFQSTVLSRLSQRALKDSLQNVSAQFTIDEQGKVRSAGISRSSGSGRIDSILLDAIRAMPAWTPAEAEPGKKTSQKFIVRLPAQKAVPQTRGGGEGC